VDSAVVVGGEITDAHCTEGIEGYGPWAMARREESTGVFDILEWRDDLLEPRSLTALVE
jgi:hypothetical protein